MDLGIEVRSDGDEAVTQAIACNTLPGCPGAARAGTGDAAAAGAAPELSGSPSASRSAVVRAAGIGAGGGRTPGTFIEDMAAFGLAGATGA
jgi:hypothetical protein